MVVAGPVVFFIIIKCYLKTPIPPVRTNLFGRQSENVLNERDVRLVIIEIVSIQLGSQVGIEFALNYVILPTLIRLKQELFHLLDLSRRASVGNQVNPSNKDRGKSPL